MISTGRFWLLLTLVTLLLFILGCGEDGGGAAIEPLADEPMIVDSVMCLDIDDTRPVWITDSFLTSDKEIYIWIYWSNIQGESDVEAVWYGPDEESPFREDSLTIGSSTGFGITWFFIEKPSDGFPEGEWSVDIYLDGSFERSYLFMLES
jgi:hypothetical protein